MKGQRARIEHKQAYLSTEFGMQLALRKFNLSPEKLEAVVGRIRSGKRKGLLRGRLTWKKCTVGGWVVDGPGHLNGHVQRPGSYGYEIKESHTDKVLWNEHYQFHHEQVTP